MQPNSCRRHDSRNNNLPLQIKECFIRRYERGQDEPSRGIACVFAECWVSLCGSFSLFCQMRFGSVRCCKWMYDFPVVCGENSRGLGEADELRRELQTVSSTVRCLYGLFKEPSIALTLFRSVSSLGAWYRSCRSNLEVVYSIGCTRMRQYSWYTLVVCIWLKRDYSGADFMSVV